MKRRKPKARVRDFSLRDYFAATVLNGLSAAAYSAREIYDMADAMLAAREKE